MTYFYWLGGVGWETLEYLNVARGEKELTDI